MTSVSLIQCAYLGNVPSKRDGFTDHFIRCDRGWIVCITSTASSLSKLKEEEMDTPDDSVCIWNLELPRPELTGASPDLLTLGGSLEKKVERLLTEW